jgi:hypothetical protein
MVNMLSLSQGDYHPLGDDDEHVSATQFDDEVNSREYGSCCITKITYKLYKTYSK